MHRNSTRRAAHASCAAASSPSSASPTTSVLRRPRDPVAFTEESLRLYRLAAMAGSSTLTNDDDRAAVRALQNLSASQWQTTRRFLRMVAAEKGVDVESGDKFHQQEKGKLTHSPQLSTTSSSLRHPAWDEAVHLETPEERLHVGVQRDLVALEASHRFWNPSKAARLGTLLVLDHLRSILNEPHLKAKVLPWTLTALAKGLCLSHAFPQSSSVAIVSKQTAHQQAPPSPQALSSPLYSEHLLQRLGRLDRRFPQWTREVDSVYFVSSMCSDIDEVLLARVAETLFVPAVKSSQGDPEPTVHLPPHLNADRLHEIFPRWPVAPTSSTSAIHCVRERLDKLIHRTLRGDVSQGVIIPDVDALVNQFDRVVSLSQHREVLIPFRVLVELLQMSSLDSNDWRKYRIRKHLKQLLLSITTDRHAPDADTHQREAPDSFGGVTLIGLSDEIALMTHKYSTDEETWEGGGSPFHLGRASSSESIAWTAKYVDLARRRITANGGVLQQHENEATMTQSKLSDPIALLLAGFGVVPSSHRAVASRKQSLSAIGRVLVMSRDADVQAACFSVGVDVLR